MAYNLRYYNEFISQHYQRLVRVEVLERDYSGSSERIKMGASIHLSDSGDGREEPIKKLTANLRLLSTRNFQFEHLFTADDRKYKVSIFRDGSSVFEGFLESDSYSEPYYSYKDYTVNLTARDNLGRLEDIPFLDDNGDRYEGLDTAWVTLQRALLKTGLTLPVDDNGLSIKSSDMGVGNTLIQTYVNNDLFWDYEENKPKDCLFVITTILQGFGAQIRQQNGKWAIVEQGEYFLRPFKQGGSASFPKWMRDQGLNIPEVIKDYRWVNRDAEMTILPSWKEFDISQLYNAYDNSFPYFPIDINDFTFVGPSRSNYTINGWDMQDIPYVSPIDNGRGGFRMLNYSSSSPSGSIITQKFAVKQTGNDFKITLSSRLVSGARRDNTPLVITRNIKIDIIVLTDPVLSQGYILGDNGWETYDGTQFKKIEFSNIDSSVEFQDLSIITDGIPADGDLIIRLWPITDVTNFAGLDYELITYKFISENYPIGGSINAEINENNNVTSDNVEFNIGQVDDFENSSLTFKGGLFDSSGNAQKDWKRAGDSTAKYLLEAVAIGYDLHNRQPSRQVNGTVIWDHDIWTNIDDQNKRLMINSIDEWNMNTDEMTAEFVEVFEYKNTVGAFDDGYDEGYDNQSTQDYQTNTTFTINEKFE